MAESAYSIGEDYRLEEVGGSTWRWVDDSGDDAWIQFTEDDLVPLG